MKATQLEQMKEDYSYIMETKERTKEQISQGEEVCKCLMQMFLKNSYSTYKINGFLKLYTKYRYIGI